MDGVEAHNLDDTNAIHDLARQAESEANWSRMEELWSRFIRVSKNPHWWAWTLLGRSLYMQGRFAEGAEMFNVARVRHPKDRGVFIHHLNSLSDTDRRDEMRNVVSSALAKFADWPTGEWLWIGHCALRCGALESAEACSRHIPRDINDGRIGGFLAAVQSAMAEAGRVQEFVGAESLLMRFESLGGGYPGCEIGLVQRRFGAEPLGLLRWTTIEPSDLVAALRCRFEGVGSMEQTEVVAAATGDYKTKDRRFGMDMMTFTPISAMSPEEMHTRSCRRISFLRGKLIEDLTVSDKIFVYRTADDSLDLNGIREIKDAMSQYGRNRLLYIRLATDTHPTGSIEQIADDMVIGRVGRFSRQPAHELFLDGWMEIFAAAAELLAVMAEPARCRAMQ